MTLSRTNFVTCIVAQLNSDRNISLSVSTNWTYRSTKSDHSCCWDNTFNKYALLWFLMWHCWRVTFFNALLIPSLLLSTPIIDLMLPSVSSMLRISIDDSVVFQPTASQSWYKVLSFCMPIERWVILVSLFLSKADTPLIKLAPDVTSMWGSYSKLVRLVLLRSPVMITSAANLSISQSINERLSIDPCCRLTFRKEAVRESMVQQLNLNETRQSSLFAAVQQPKIPSVNEHSSKLMLVILCCDWMMEATCAKVSAAKRHWL